MIDVLRQHAADEQILSLLTVQLMGTSFFKGDGTEDLCSDAINDHCALMSSNGGGFYSFRSGVLYKISE